MESTVNEVAEKNLFKWYFCSVLSRPSDPNVISMCTQNGSPLRHFIHVNIHACTIEHFVTIDNFTVCSSFQFTNRFAVSKPHLNPIPMIRKQHTAKLH